MVLGVELKLSLHFCNLHGWMNFVAECYAVNGRYFVDCSNFEFHTETVVVVVVVKDKVFVPLVDLLDSEKWWMLTG